MMGYYKLYANIYSLKKQQFLHSLAMKAVIAKKFVLLFTSGVPKALNSIIGTCIMS